MRLTPLVILGTAFALSVPSVASAEAAPPAGSKALTEILRPIETKPDFAYLEEVELEDGLYKIEYHTKDGKKQKIEVDPLTGPPARARRGAKRICYLSTCHSFPLSIASSARERVAPTVYFSSKPLLGA